jgi:hypothetical protein
VEQIFCSPDLGALPLGAFSKARRLTYGNQADGSSKEPVLGRVSREGPGERYADPSLLLLTTGAPRDSPRFGGNREVTMQHCIQIRKAKLCPRESKKIGFGRYNAVAEVEHSSQIQEPYPQVGAFRVRT